MLDQVGDFFNGQCLGGFKLICSVGGLNVGGSAEYTMNAHQKEQIHDNMTNLMQQSQQLSVSYCT